jgi:CRP/FNR family transcriptional regulator, dissimilatory nitrate respiration regulator
LRCRDRRGGVDNGGNIPAMTIDECLNLAAAGSSVLQTFGVRENLFRRGTPTTGVYVVVEGCVKLARLDATGKEVILYVARAGDPFAEASIFSPVYHCDAVAVTAASVRRYPKAAVLAKFDSDPAFAKAYAAMLGRQLMDVRARMERLNMHSARDRVRHFLILQTEPASRCVEIRGTLKNLAAELGMTHEALYRTLARMAEEGEIKRAGNLIWLLSRD